MDGSLAIEDNRQKLKRIVATLVDMAGLAAPAPEADKPAYVSDSPLTASRCLSLGLPEARPEGSPPLPLKGGEERGASSQPPTPLPRRSGERWPAKRVGEGVDLKRGAPGAKPLTLPRILWRAILALLRPAESAARRLIIAAARGMVVPVPRLREPKPKPRSMVPFMRKYGLAVSYRFVAAEERRVNNGRAKAKGGPALRSSTCPPKLEERRGKSEGGRIPAFRLLDPPRRFAFHGAHRRTVPPHLAPRICVPGITERAPLPPPPSPDDPVSAESITRRIAALAAALDDLPGQARRFARLKARLDARHARDPKTPHRTSPIRRGRPPGGRLLRFEPGAVHPRNIREIDEILAYAHALALFALEYPDTS